MTPEPIVLAPGATIAEALAHVRNPDITPALAGMVFVCRPPSATPTGRYLGCVHSQGLLREAPSELVAGVLDAELTRLGPDASLAEVTRYFATYNLVCGPVIDENGHLLGAVTVDDVLDHLLPRTGASAIRRRPPPADPPRPRRQPPPSWSPPWLSAHPPPARPAATTGRTAALGVDAEAFGRVAERLARFLGTGTFLLWQTVIVVIWITLNVFAIACSGIPTRSSCSTWRSRPRPPTPRR